MDRRPLLVVRVNIAPDKEAEWNDWYSNIHVPDLLTVPGFVSGRRYAAIRGEPKYMTIYQFESEEAMKRALKSEAFQRVAGWGEWEAYISDMTATLYRQIYP